MNLKAIVGGGALLLVGVGIGAGRHSDKSKSEAIIRLARLKPEDAAALRLSAATASERHEQIA